MMGKKMRILKPGIAIRSFPYPYHAMLAICSDLDETPDWRAYYEIMRFLNTNEETIMGRGVGLEVGNTIYFDMPPDQFAYWNTDDIGRAIVRDLIRSGHIDCLHSYGTLATTRGHAGRALEELDRHGCRIETWIDHGTAITNLDGDIMKGAGDVSDNPAYHADLTRAFGINYFWLGRVTSVIGQNTKKSLAGIWSPTHPVDSGKTVLKELAKGLCAHAGNMKYSMHAKNRVLRQSALRDGQNIYEFMRCNPHWGGVSSGETAGGIAEVLAPNFLDRLVMREGVCILYTHLGKISCKNEIFPRDSRNVFRLLSTYVAEGKILVTTTRRLLGYCRMLEEATFNVKSVDGIVRVDVNYPGPECDLAGLTFQLAQEVPLEVSINCRNYEQLRRNHQAESHVASFSLPWMPLEFPRG